MVPPLKLLPAVWGMLALVKIKMALNVKRLAVST